VGEGVSMELCGGTHTSRTGDVGLFKILAESAVGANVRRIEAVTGQAALEHVQRADDDLRHLAALLKSSPEQLGERVEKLLKDQKQKEREVESLKAKLLSSQSGDLLAGVREIGGVPVLVQEVQADSPKELRDFADRLKERLPSGVIVLGARGEGKAMLLCVVTKDLVEKHKAGDLMRRLSEMVGGKGGGRPDMAQGGGPNPDNLKTALEAVYGMIG
jgi:alanyl-tRNA synthetase